MIERKTGGYMFTVQLQRQSILLDSFYRNPQLKQEAKSTMCRIYEIPVELLRQSVFPKNNVHLMDFLGIVFLWLYKLLHSARNILIIIHSLPSGGKKNSNRRAK